MDWLLGIASLVVGIALLYMTIDRKYKQAFLFEFIMWIIIILNTSLMSGFRLDQPSTYLSIGIFIAFIGRVFLFFKKK
jgi:hypothetical protein